MTMQTRQFEIRSTDIELREVSGIAVPYNETIDIGGGLKERFEKGAIDVNADVKLFRDHNDIIGKVTELREENDGLHIRAKISETQLGNETLELVKDGAIRSFSVGFIPLKDEKQDRTIIRKKVDLKEVSLVAFPAYDKAAVMAVRENKEETSVMEIQNTTDTSADIAEVRTAIEEIDRKVALLAAEKDNTVEPVVSFRSYGEYVKSVANNDDEGLKLHRDFTGGVLADSILKNQWVSDTVRILNQGRPTYSVFSTGTLPADGMTLEYPVLDTDTSTVDEQAAEADTLAFGKISLTSATAPIKTIGGYTEMSRQVIERSSIAYVDTAFRAMVAAYAKKTNNMAKAALVANAGNFNTASVSAWSADAIIEALADSAMKVNEDTGLPVQFILASSDVFKSLAKIVDASDRPVLSNTGATVNTFGAINPVGLTGSLFGLPIVVDPSLAAGSMYVGNSAALTTYESAGAPFRLNDEEITNLTNKFSVYGYLAISAPDTKALVVVANPND